MAQFLCQAFFTTKLPKNNLFCRNLPYGNDRATHSDYGNPFGQKCKTFRETRGPHA